MSSPFTADQLWDAWERVQENAGCAGSDGVTVAQFARRAHREIPRLLERVGDRSYRPYPLLKIVVEKRPGSSDTRTLLVPAVADRLLQTAAARELSRSFEEEFLECSYGYRPGRSVDRAIARIRKCRELGYCYVVDGDIRSFFDRVEHGLLLTRLAERRLSQEFLELLRLWIRAQIWDGHRVRPLPRGLPQGSPVSPLLANLFLEDFDRELEKSGRKLVRYADDFLILARSREDASAALQQAAAELAEAGLELNAEKTGIVDFEQGFRFLGALFWREAVWVPWKNSRTAGRLLYMARPLPASLRSRYEYAPPRSAMELAFARTGLARLPPPPRKKGGSEVAFLYLTEQGSVLRKAGDRFLVEKEDEILLDLPYHKLECVLLFGSIQVTTQALAELLEKGVQLSLFSRYGFYRGALTPPRAKNIDLRLAQFDLHRDGSRALQFARAVVRNKIENGLAVLSRYRRHADAAVAGEVDAAADGLQAAAAQTATAADLAALDGIEGNAARTYFSTVMRFNRSTMSWQGRRKHPPTDPLNSLLSLAYTLLANELTALLEGLGLDPYLGFFHQPDYGRQSLALDLLEAFRHPVADRLALTLVNRGSIAEDDFHKPGDGPAVFLTTKALKRFFAEYEKWMLRSPRRGDGADGGGAPARSFRRLLQAEAEALARALREGVAFRPFCYQPEGGPEEVECNTSSVTT